MTPNLDAVLEDVQFAAPVSIEDCTTVRDALREVFPKASIEVYCHTGNQVVIKVDKLQRQLTVVGV